MYVAREYLCLYLCRVCAQLWKCPRSYSCPAADAAVGVSSSVLQLSAAAALLAAGAVPRDRCVRLRGQGTAAGDTRD